MLSFKMLDTSSPTKAAWRGMGQLAARETRTGEGDRWAVRMMAAGGEARARGEGMPARGRNGAELRLDATGHRASGGRRSTATVAGPAAPSIPRMCHPEDGLEGVLLPPSSPPPRACRQAGRPGDKRGR